MKLLTMDLFCSVTVMTQTICRSGTDAYPNKLG